MWICDLLAKDPSVTGGSDIQRLWRIKALLGPNVARTTDKRDTSAAFPIGVHTVSLTAPGSEHGSFS